MTAGRARRTVAALPLLVLLTVLALLAPWLGVGVSAGQPTTTEGSGATPPTTAATSGTPAPTGGTTTTPGAPQLTLEAQTPFISPPDTIEMLLDVRNPPEGAVLSFYVWFPITNLDHARTNLDAYVAGTATRRPPGGIFQRVPNVPLALFPTTADGRVKVSIPVAPEGVAAPEFGLQIGFGGVFPMTVVLSTPERGAQLVSAWDGAEAEAKLTTYLVSLPPGRGDVTPLSVATVLPFRAPLALQPDGTSTMDATTTTRLRSALDVLGRHPDAPVTVDPSPETVDSLGRIEAAGPVDPATFPTAALLSRTMAGRHLLGSSYVGLDLDAWVAAGMTTELDRQLTLGSAVLVDRLQPTSAPDRSTWVAGGGTAPAVLSQLRQFGVEQLVVDEATVAPLDPQVFDARTGEVAALAPFEVENADGGRLRAATVEPRLSDRLRATDDPVLNAQIAVADLAVLFYGAESPLPAADLRTPRGVVLRPGSDGVSLASFDRLLGALGAPTTNDGTVATTGAAIVAPADLDAVLALEPARAPRTATPLVRAYAPGEPGPPLDAYRQQLAGVQRSLGAYRSMSETTAPDALAQLERLLDVSGVASLDASGRQRYLDAVAGDLQQVLGAVQMPAEEQVTLTDTEGEIPLRLDNQLDHAVQARVRLTSDKLDFPDGNNLVVTLEPGQNRVPVKVRTRSPGGFPLDIRVSSPDEQQVLATSRFQVRSLVFSGVGLVLSIGAGFFLLLWWARHFRRTRRARKLVASDEAIASDGGTGGPGDAERSDGQVDGPVGATADARAGGGDPAGDRTGTDDRPMQVPNAPAASSVGPVPVVAGPTAPPTP